MEVKRQRARSDQAVPLDIINVAWRHFLAVTRRLHPKRRYHKELHTFAPRIFGNARVGWRIPDDEDTASIDDARLRGLYNLTAIFERMDFMVKQHNASLNVKAPFPSSPQVPPIVGIKFTRDHQFVAYHTFAAWYSAKAFVDFIIQHSRHKPSWLNDDTITLGEVTISTEKPADLERIMEYSPTGDEKLWELPMPYPQYALSILHQSVDDAPASTPDRHKRSPAREAPPPGTTPSATRKTRPERAPRREETSNPGMIDIATIADALKITPRHARGILRDLKITKPASGRWEWPTTEANGIKATIKELLK